MGAQVERRIRARPGAWRLMAATTLPLITGCGDAGGDVPRAAVVDPASRAVSVDAEGLEVFIMEQLDELRIPGAAVAIVDREGVIFSGGYGWADLENRVPMTPDTVTNIASISKTITSTVVLQLCDRGVLDLDEDVSNYLPFAVRHPDYPETPITLRQLLTHTAGIGDGDAYDASYACGDPAVSLASWIRGYLMPGGEFFSAEQNFLPSAPGVVYSYSNVGYGLAGYLVEVVSGRPFEDFVSRFVFEPLAMSESGFFLTDVDPDRQAVPYAWSDAGDTLENPLFDERSGEQNDQPGFVSFCPYSFFNTPDGLVRTSVHQLAQFLVAYMRGGELGGQRILAASTVEESLSSQLESSLIEDEGFVQGLAWRRQQFVAGWLWGHSGGDPGIRSHMLFSPEASRGVIVFANRMAPISPILDRLIEEALKTPDSNTG